MTTEYVGNQMTGATGRDIVIVMQSLILASCQMAAIGEHCGDCETIDDLLLKHKRHKLAGVIVILDVEDTRGILYRHS